MKRLGTILILAALFSGVSAQTDPVWQVLASVKFEEPSQNYRSMDLPAPIFNPEIESLDGQEVTLDGYIYPLEGTRASKHFVLSALPIESCYFCGGGGPETVVEIYAAEPVPYSKDKIYLKGNFKLNKEDPLGVIYSVVDATLEEKDH